MPHHRQRIKRALSTFAAVSSTTAAAADTSDRVFVRFRLPAATATGDQPHQTALPVAIEDAQLKLMVRTHATGRLAAPAAANQTHVLAVYQLLEPGGRPQLLGERRFHLAAHQLQQQQQHRHHRQHLHHHHQWLDVSVTAAVRQWRRQPAANLGLLLHCVDCAAAGLHIVHADSPFEAAVPPAQLADAAHNGPELFVVAVADADAEAEAAADDLNAVDDATDDDDDAGDDGAAAAGHRQRRSRQKHRHTADGGAERRRVPRKTECTNGNRRCCRHRLDVVFQDVRGFEFIMQPLHFDAGYCRGKCPPRYNPAHQHAVLQSMLWLQDPQRVGRPCCAPSRLEELEVLHMDEEDATKMRVSTWTDMRVLECACS